MKSIISILILVISLVLSSCSTEAWRAILIGTGDALEYQAEKNEQKKQEYNNKKQKKVPLSSYNEYDRVWVCNGKIHTGPSYQYNGCKYGGTGLDGKWINFEDAIKYYNVCKMCIDENE